MHSILRNDEPFSLLRIFLKIGWREKGRERMKRHFVVTLIYIFIG